MSSVVTIDIAERNGPNSFYPSPASVGTGQTVVWRNDDTIAHHVVFDAIQVDAGTLAPGTLSQPITIAAGTWGYHCAIHPSMVGTVTIAGADSSPAPAPY
jgi:plastocyanin